MTQSSSLPWWRTDEYVSDIPMPDAFVDHAGPKGPALVRAWPDGRTDPGWGLFGKDGSPGFIERYNRGDFTPEQKLFGYEHGKWAFAYVMRAFKMVCVDIDGKNGGLDHAKRLGMLPPTLAETSKSGNGYHLFYLVDDQWDSQTGYSRLSDRIGIEQGVDIRATGCVYHHDTQRWNMRDVVKLPEHLLELLQHRDQKIAQQNARITKVLENNDTLEVLMMQDQMISDLAKPIPHGKRNQTLFAIGSQMFLGQVPDWETKIRDRAHEIGLATEEAEKLVANIQRYGANAQVTP